MALPKLPLTPSEDAVGPCSRTSALPTTERLPLVSAHVPGLVTTRACRSTPNRRAAQHRAVRTRQVPGDGVFVVEDPLGAKPEALERLVRLSIRDAPTQRLGDRVNRREQLAGAVKVAFATEDARPDRVEDDRRPRRGVSADPGKHRRDRVLRQIRADTAPDEERRGPLVVPGRAISVASSSRVKSTGTKRTPRGSSPSRRGGAARALWPDSPGGRPRTPAAPRADRRTGTDANRGPRPATPPRPGRR